MKLRSTLQRAGLVLGLASIAAPILAGPKQDWRDCKRGSPDEVIQGCMRIIEGRREGKHNLSIAYTNRGIAYGKTGHLDRAIADYDQAIKLNPRFASAYRNRGFAYESKGEKKRAIADYRKAIELNPGDPRATAGLMRLGVTP